MLLLRAVRPPRADAAAGSKNVEAEEVGDDGDAADRARTPRDLLAEQCIQVDVHELFLDESTIQMVRVAWRLRPTSLLDWIGLFDADEPGCTAYVDYRMLGGNTPTRHDPPSSSLVWQVPGVLFDLRRTTHLQFRYFDGLTGRQRAVSPRIFVSATPEILITSLKCFLPPPHGPLLARILTSLPEGESICTCRGSSRAETTSLSSGRWEDLAIRLRAPLGGVVDIEVVEVSEEEEDERTGDKERIREKETDASERGVRGGLAEQGERVREKRRGRRREKRRPLLQTQATVDDFLAASRQSVNVAVRKPQSQRRSRNGRETPRDDSSASLLLHFALVPQRPEEMPGGSADDRMLTSMISTTSSSSGTSHRNSNLSLVKERLGPLPPGWETRIDWHGRIFYLDHANRRTTWRRPELPSSAAGSSLRSTDGAVSTLQHPHAAHAGSKFYQPTRRTVTAAAATSTSADRDSIAARFLQRDDFISLLHTNEIALRIYNSSKVVKHVLHKIRKGSSFTLATFEQHSEFVDFVNSFADATQRLPAEWQAVEGRPTIFIDHSSRRTTLLDPRLPLPSQGTGRQQKEQRRQRRTRSAPPTRDVNGNDVAAAAAAILLGRDASLLASRLPELAPRLQRKLRLLERLGADARAARLASDIELATAISLLESEEQKERASSSAPIDPLLSSSSGSGLSDHDEAALLLDEKLAHFYGSLQRSGYAQGPAKIRLRISRPALLHDAFEQILAADAQQLRRARLSIAFDDEEGLDYGGPSRELFFLLSRELFNPYYGLFQYAAADRYTVQISHAAALVNDNLKWMEFAGRVLGLALVHRCLVDTFFTVPFYKLILEQPYTLADLEQLDPEFGRSLKWLRENSISETDGYSFCVTEEAADGELVDRDLLPNGASLAVNDRNKEQFVQLLLKWRVERGAQPQAAALLRGLHQIIGRDFLSVFSPSQLELVLCGSLDIDLDDWQSNTEYKGGYSSSSVVIRWFWDTVEEMNNADRLKLLQFVTGTASVPFEGFRALRGSNGSKKFTIERWGDEQSLPRAHTCFNRLDLPSYPSRQTLREKLRLSIHEGIAYAIE